MPTSAIARLGFSPNSRAATSTIRWTLRAASARMYSTGRPIRDSSVAIKCDAAVSLSSHDGVRDVGDAGRRGERVHKLEPARGNVVEQAAAGAEEDRRDVDGQLVQQP